jgi:hypothetical protein
MDKKRPDWPFLIVILFCGAAIFVCAAYLGYHYVYLPARVERQNARYEALYHPEATEAPVSTKGSTVEPTEGPSEGPTDEPSEGPTEGPAASPAPTDGTKDVADVPLGTPGPDTIVYAFPTPPPVLESFQALLALNPETVGYLTIGDMISLPVAQRENDNELPDPRLRGRKE